MSNYEDYDAASTDSEGKLVMDLPPSSDDDDGGDGDAAADNKLNFARKWDASLYWQLNEQSSNSVTSDIRLSSSSILETGQCFFHGASLSN